MKNNFFKKIVVFLTSVLPVTAFAGLPTPASVAGGVNTSSPLDFFKGIFTSGMSMAATAVGAIIVLGALYAIYSAFVEAREKQNWKSFALTSIVSVVIMVAAVVIASLAITYGTL